MIRRLVAAVPAMLVPQGTLLLEVGWKQANDVEALIRQTGRFEATRGLSRLRRNRPRGVGQHVVTLESPPTGAAPNFGYFLAAFASTEELSVWNAKVPSIAKPLKPTSRCHSISTAAGFTRCKTGIPFLDHMLSMVARHGFFDLEVAATGDLDVDYHHTVEDVGICLGQAFHQAMGSKQGLRRYASASVPLEETLANVVVDFCDRPYLVYNVDAPPGRIGTFDVELVENVLSGLCQPQPRHAALQSALRSQPPPHR